MISLWIPAFAGMTGCVFVIPAKAGIHIMRFSDLFVIEPSL